MVPQNSSDMFDSELKIFNQLEGKIDLLVEKYKKLKSERDTAMRQKSELETLLRRRETQIAQLQDNLAEAQKRALSPEKEKLIKEKLLGLSERLKGI